MKAHALVYALLICITHLAAQNPLPQMKVWSEIPNAQYGGTMFCLPNFDTARGGFSAVSFWRHGQKNGTWYNRFPGDTVNSFPWADEIADINRGDFDGDGILDYCANGGWQVYKGIAHCTPPNTSATVDYPVSQGVVPSYVADYNGDHLDDILVRFSRSPDNTLDLGRILIGSQDLRKMKSVVLPRTSSSSEYYECIVDVFTTVNGSMRIITANYRKVRFQAPTEPRFDIWEVNFVGSTDSLSARYANLSSMAANVTNAIDVANNINVFHSIDKITNAICFGSPTQAIFLTSNDQFEFLKSGSLAKQYTYIPASSTYEWQDLDGDLAQDTVHIDGVICRGNPTGYFEKVMRFKGFVWIKPQTFVGMISNVICVGDVNHDGLNDYLVFYEFYDRDDPRPRLVYYLGADKADDVDPDAVDDEDFVLIVPNPVKDRNQLNCRVINSTDKPVCLDLFDLRGRLIEHLWQGVASTTGTRLSFDISGLRLQSGWYNLKATCGKRHIDMSIVVE